MKYSFISAAALVGVAVAQSNQTLTQALNATPELRNLTTYIGQFPGFIEQLSAARNITILAPSNSAFAAFLTSPEAIELAQDPEKIRPLLQYHILNGTYYSSNLTNVTSFLPTLLTDTDYTNVTGGQRLAAAVVNGNATFFSALFDNATVTRANLNFTGGVIHIIDSLLTVPENVSTTAIDANLTSLYGAADRIDALDTIDELEDVTIFAPNNAAFRAIGSVFQNLTSAQIANVLTYHVVNGTVGYSSGLTNGTTLQTLNGGSLTVQLRNGTVWVNNAKVITANVLVANGVVHVIDNVLNPGNTTAAPDSTATTGTPAFPGATSVTDEPFTSGVPTPTSTIATDAGPPSSPTTSTTGNAAMPMKTGGVAPAMLFGGAAVVLMNL